MGYKLPANTIILKASFDVTAPPLGCGYLSAFLDMVRSIKKYLLFASGKAPELLAATTKKRRKRKGKLPKNYDPKVDPDPERWLARKDRSTYKGRRRDKRKDGGIGKGTQGGVGNTEALDASKPAPGM